MSVTSVVIVTTAATPRSKFSLTKISPDNALTLKKFYFPINETQISIKSRNSNKILMK